MSADHSNSNQLNSADSNLASKPAEPTSLGSSELEAEAVKLKEEGLQVEVETSTFEPPELLDRLKLIAEQPLKERAVALEAIYQELNQKLSASDD